MYFWKKVFPASMSHKKVYLMPLRSIQISHDTFFLKGGLEILRTKPCHSVPHLIQTCFCVIVNSWSVLNIKATWFNYSSQIFYAQGKVSMLLKSCRQFQAFKILIIYYLNIATASFPMKTTKLLLKEFDAEYCTRLCLYTLPPSWSNCLISLAAFKDF